MAIVRNCRTPVFFHLLLLSAMRRKPTNTSTWALVMTNPAALPTYLTTNGISGMSALRYSQPLEIAAAIAREGINIRLIWWIRQVAYRLQAFVTLSEKCTVSTAIVISLSGPDNCES